MSQAFDAILDQQRPSLRERLAAWWRGYELPRPAAKPAGLARSRTKSHTPTANGWSEERRNLVQQLFGEGMATPEDSHLLERMIRPLGLDERATVVVLSAGLGGLCRRIAAETGAYVTGFEADADLVKAGMELSVKHGLARKAEIRQAAKTSIDVRARSVDAIVAEQALFGVPDKPALLTCVREALKPGGQLMLRELLATGDTTSPAFAAWEAREPAPPSLFSPDELRADLEQLGFEVRIVENVTRDYRRALLDSFGTLASRMRNLPPDDPLLRVLMVEGELWKGRLSVIDQDLVQVFRVYARLPGVKELI